MLLNDITRPLESADNFTVKCALALEGAVPELAHVLSRDGDYTQTFAQALMGDAPPAAIIKGSWRTVRCRMTKQLCDVFDAALRFALDVDRIVTPVDRIEILASEDAPSVVRLLIVPGDDASPHPYHGLFSLIDYDCQPVNAAKYRGTTYLHMTYRLQTLEDLYWSRLQDEAEAEALVKEARQWSH